MHFTAYTQAPFDAARPCGRCCSGGAGFCGGCPTAVPLACFSAKTTSRRARISASGSACAFRVPDPAATLKMGIYSAVPGVHSGERTDMKIQFSYMGRERSARPARTGSLVGRWRGGDDARSGAAMVRGRQGLGSGLRLNPGLLITLGSGSPWGQAVPRMIVT